MEMLKHKKFQGALVASLTVLFGSYASGLASTGNFAEALSLVEWVAVIAPWVVAIGAQGVADVGKEAAKINKAAQLSDTD